MVGPALPARVRAGKRAPVPSSSQRAETYQPPKEITLEDGTKIPVKIPPGMPPAQAKALVEHLTNNPELAKQMHAQAMHMLKTPGMASAFMQATSGQMQMTKEQAQQFEFLKDDPELKHVFEDVQANGPQAVNKYWDDEELMLKINAKLRAQQLKLQQEAGQAPPAPPPITNLFDAAKQGDVEAATRYLDDGADVNGKNDKGVTVLGIAVGYNRADVVSLLLERGADVAARDGKGNTVLHYAAAYGRKQVCEMLIAKGADLEATNDAKITPLDAAKQNKEKELVGVLKTAWKAAKKAQAAAST